MKNVESLNLVELSEVIGGKPKHHKKSSGINWNGLTKSALCGASLGVAAGNIALGDIPGAVSAAVGAYGVCR